jgi:5-methylcytosine-specific restriction endonuclease McrA
MMGRPCLDCGTITRATRCPSCARHHDRQRQARRGDLYRKGWPQRARAQVEAYPVCATCGSTTDLTADHVVPGWDESPLQTLCRACNAARANRGRSRAQG